MRTKLYKDITTDCIKTFAELKSEYETVNDCEIEIDDDSMLQTIHENLWSCGGNIQVISDNDEILRWCNDYAECVEAEKTFSTDEIDGMLRDIYIAVIKNDYYMVEVIKDNLYLEYEEDMQLYKRLIDILDDKGEK